MSEKDSNRFRIKFPVKANFELSIAEYIDSIIAFSTSLEGIYFGILF